MRTLVIASAASAAAAAVTSQLWIRGTWIAAAVTPVLVTIVSELLDRPSARIARAMTSDSPALPASARPAPEPETREVDAPRTAAGPGPDGPPVRVYRQPPPRSPRRRFAVGLVLATAGIAFVIGVTVFTATELLAGESIGKSGGRTTLLSSDKSDSEPDAEQRDRTRTETGERTTPDRPETQPTTPDRPETQPTTPDRPETQPTTPEETTPTAPAPAGEPEAAP